MVTTSVVPCSEEHFVELRSSMKARRTIDCSRVRGYTASTDLSSWYITYAANW
jgi:hypothetical protein